MWLKLIVCVFLVGIVAGGNAPSDKCKESDNEEWDEYDVSPPQTELGAYLFHDENKVYLFYKPANECFGDEVYKWDRTTDPKKLSTHATPRVIDVELDNTKDYLFYVHSKTPKYNVKSLTSSYWLVRNIHERCRPVQSKYEEKWESNDLIEVDITWNAKTREPFDNEHTYGHACAYVTSFTVFWCKSAKTPRTPVNKCTGPIDFVKVPANDFADSYTKTLTLKKLDNNHKYQFALSANTGDSSSGMVWSTEKK